MSQDVALDSDLPPWCEAIRSNISEERLHFKISRPTPSKDGATRVDVTPPSEFLQVGVMLFIGDKSFAPHIHKEREESSSTFLAQESWVVISGEVEVSYFDLDESLICQRFLGPGDMSVTLRGGHGYRARGENCVIYEFKTGPYRGVELDKKLIDVTV